MLNNFFIIFLILISFSKFALSNEPTDIWSLNKIEKNNEENKNNIEENKNRIMIAADCGNRGPDNREICEKISKGGGIKKKKRKSRKKKRKTNKKRKRNKKRKTKRKKKK